ncbi:MAG: FAD:protein FMN transferase [Pirellulaceae bacterium]
MSPRKSTRRQFLRGEAAIDAVADLADGIAAETPPGAPGASGVGEARSQPPPVADAASAAYLLEVSRDAMACKFALYLNAGQHGGAAERCVEALDRLEPLEQQMSVYREQSEVSRLNRTAAEQPVEVEPGLAALFARAIEHWRQTGGAFDMTAGPLSKVWGFYRRAGGVPDEAALAEALSRVGTQRLDFDAEERTIHFQTPGMEINLGGIGKGHALDDGARHLTSEGVSDFLFHGGHSSVLARGSRLGPNAPAGGGWLVGVRHPLRPERRLAEIVLRDRALGTSGSASQSFYYQGKRYGHILDPRNGWPADRLLSATVITASAADADALATAFYVMGVEAAFDYCRRHAGVAALLVSPGKRRGTIELHDIGLEADQWRQLEE